MNYWHIQLHPADQKSFGREEVCQILIQTGLIGVGEWPKGRGKIKQFREELKVGHIVLVRSKSPLALVEVMGEPAFDPTPRGRIDWFENRRNVKILSWFNQEVEREIGKTVDRIYNGTSFASANKSVFIKKWYQLTRKSEMLEEANRLLKHKGQIILQGPPGTGKTRLAKELAAQLITAGGESKLIQFHPSYAYEDFVRGIVAEPVNGGNGVAYEVRNKILAAFAAKAEADPAHPYVLIIDEINRANLSAVLGELIYALEYRYDAKAEETQRREAVVESPYGVKAAGSDTVDYELRLPKNLLLIGTMNTADRSAGSLDYAIRRRFAFVEIGPDEKVIPTEAGKALFRKVAALFEGSGNFLSPEFRKEDVQPGHSYFMEVADGLPLADRLKYEIQPLLHEYLRDGILLPTANNAAEKKMTDAREAIAALRAE